jgi:hypothetical protein
VFAVSPNPGRPTCHRAVGSALISTLKLAAMLLLMLPNIVVTIHHSRLSPFAQFGFIRLVIGPSRQINAEFFLIVLWSPGNYCRQGVERSNDSWEVRNGLVKACGWAQG